MQANQPSAERVESLKQAIKRNNVGAVEAFLQSQQNLQNGNPIIQDLINTALRYSKEDVLNAFLAHNFTSLNQAELLNAQLRFAAKHSEKLDVVQTLIEQRIDVNCADSNGNVPLMFAALKGNIAAIDYLLNCNANIGSEDLSGRTALFFATGNQHLSAVQLLISRNADVNHTNQEGQNVLLYMLEDNPRTIEPAELWICMDLIRANITPPAIGQVRQAQIEDKYADVIIKLLQHAIHNHDAVIEQKLTAYLIQLANGYTPDMANSPLMQASAAGFDHLVNLMLNQGVAIDGTNNSGHTALICASRNNQVSTVEILLNRNANINHIDAGGANALHQALENSHENVSTLLISRGINIHDREQGKGYAPLHLAALKGMASIVSLLIQNQANVNLTNNANFTPLHLAARQGHVEVAQILIDDGHTPVDCIGRTGYTPLYLAAANGQGAVLQELLQRGADVNKVSTVDMATPLHLAALNGKANTVSLLIQNNANLNVFDRTNPSDPLHRFTPLHYAASEGHPEVAELLVNAQADINCRAGYGGTPLHLAAQWHKVDVATLLIGLGADKALTNTDGQTPVDVAQTSGWTPIEIENAGF